MRTTAAGRREEKSGAMYWRSCFLSAPPHSPPPADPSRNETFRRFLAAGRALLGLVGTLVAASAFAATTYYVSPSGDDLNGGSQGAPFRQIRKGISVGVPGDTVLVAGGSYLGFDLNGMAGTPSAVFTIRAQGSGAVVTATADRSDNRDTIHILCGLSLPLLSTINYSAGQTRANNGIVPLGATGAVAVHCGQGAGTAHVVIDVNGYFQ